MINGNYRAVSAPARLPKPKRGIRPGDAVRGAATRERWGETGIVVKRGLLRTTVRWTSKETTSVRHSAVQRIRRQP